MFKSYFALILYTERFLKIEIPIEGEGLLKANLYLLKAVLILKLSKLGFDAAICHNCGKIFERTKAGETLCRECKTTLKQEKS